MEYAVVSERLLEKINGKKVIAGLFTTYTFEPDFFELEIIPLLLPQDIPYSMDERVKRFQVREALRDAQLRLQVYYDAPMFMQSSDCSPEMEYRCHGIYLGNRAFHAKLIFLLLEDDDTGEESLLVGAGSNNLSRAGWWDNIECQHWEEVGHGTSPREFLNRLSEDIAYLAGHQGLTADTEFTACDRISEFLQHCRARNHIDTVHYYGLSSIENGRNYIDFLLRKRCPLYQYQNWTLEIISPFFADDAKNREHEVFRELDVKTIHILLPIDDEKNALCHEDYYDHVQQLEDVHWAQWKTPINKDLGLTGDHFRRLHAKVYHFYNKRQSWVFVGSVNFTHKALYENMEAGFMVARDDVGPLLEPLPSSMAIERFAELDEPIPGADLKAANEEPIPELHLQYDWVNRVLKGSTAAYKKYEIQIIGAEGDALIGPWILEKKESVYEGEVDELERFLGNGSLVKITGTNLKNQQDFPEHRVLLQQIGWSHKPLDLPALSPEQILSIYADASPERRHLMLLNAKIRELVLSGQGVELTTHQDEQLIDQFFCEYAEIFNAFRTLNKKLHSALERENENLVDYYLTGTGVDSLPTLIEQALREDEGKSVLSPVTVYLLLLSALEIYRNEDFVDRPNVREKEAIIKEAVAMIKQQDRLKLEDDSLENRKAFFGWFEYQFFKQYNIEETQ